MCNTCNANVNFCYPYSNRCRGCCDGWIIVQRVCRDAYGNLRAYVGNDCANTAVNVSSTCNTGNAASTQTGYDCYYARQYGLTCNTQTCGRCGNNDF